MRAARPSLIAALLVTVVVVAAGDASAVRTARADRAPAGSALDRARQSGFDVGRVVETVSHHVTRTKQGTLVARDRLYRAEFDSRGLNLRLGTSVLRLETISLSRNGSLDLSATPWRAR